MHLVRDLHIRNKKKIAFLAAMIGASLLGWQNASADSVLAVTVPSDYANSQMGTVTGSKVTTRVNAAANKAVLDNLNRDPAAYAITYNGEAGFLLRQYTYSTTEVKNAMVYTIDSNGNLKEIGEGATYNSPNIHGAAGAGKYIYSTGYDLGKVSVATIGDNGVLQETNTDDPSDPNVVSNGTKLINDIRNYAPKSTEGFTDNTAVHGEDIAAAGDKVYVLTNVNPDGNWDNYLDGYILQYKVDDNGHLEFQSYDRVGKNTDSGRLNFYNNHIFVSSIGGMQNYGSPNNLDSSHAAISAVPVNEDGTLSFNTSHEVYTNGAHTEITIPEDVKYVDKDLDTINNKGGTDFHDMKVLPDGTAYILGYVLYGSGEGFTGHLYKTTVSNLLSENPESWQEIRGGTSDGWFGKIYAGYYTKRLWLEYGNQFSVYTDGDSSPRYSWSARDFATNNGYYQFNSVSVLDNDTVTGSHSPLYKLQSEGMGTYSPETEDGSIDNADARDRRISYHSKITGTASDSSGEYKDATSDNSRYSLAGKIIGIDNNVLGDLTTNVIAAIDAHSGNDITIDGGNKAIQLSVQNYVGNPSGIYAGYGKNVSINNVSKVNIITKNFENGNSLTNAIWNDAPASGASNITINGDVNISINGGYGGNGIAVQKTNRWGESSYSSTSPSAINITGNVKIAGKTNKDWGIPINPEVVYSRFNNAGILTSVNNSAVNIGGNVDFAVYGNGVTTNAEGSSVSIGGGSIRVPKFMNYGYYTLGAYQGTINMNATDTAPGTNPVKLDGDIFALSTGTIHLGLTTADSFLNGIVDNGGNTSMWLQNGAQWTNAAQNTRYSKDNEDYGYGQKSRITYLHGGNSETSAGIINQRADSKELTIDNYSGYTTALYSHGSDPTQILGGDIRIKHADAGSHITLRTDYSDAMSSDSVKNQVLNSLASKLSYSEYVNGIRNLSGKVEISEGLTASSIAKITGDITFNSYGIGTYGGGGTEPVIPENQTKTGFVTTITGNKETNGEYYYYGVLKDDGAYHFTLDNSSVSPDNGPAVRTDNNVLIRADGHTLELTGNVDDAIDVTSGKTAEITADTLTVHGKSKAVNAAGVFKLNGTADISSDDTALYAASAGEITLSKGQVKGKITADGGSIAINSGAAAVPVTITGDVSAAENSTVQVGMNGSDSSLSGNVSGDGNISLSLKNESSWTGAGNGQNLAVSLDHAKWNSTGDSSVKSLSASHATVKSGNLNIGTYSGNSTFLFSHEINKAEKKVTLDAGKIVIGQADAGSMITLRTDNFGLDSVWDGASQTDLDNMTVSTLQQLANKLWYTASVEGEKNLTAVVNIADGLTSSAVSIKEGAVKFDSNGQGQYDPSGNIPTGDIVDMRGRGDFAIEHKDELAKTYIYGYDKATDTVDGGKITIPKVGNFNVTIQMDAAAVDMNDHTAVEKALGAAMAKLNNEGLNTIGITLEITDGLENGAEVLRNYSGTYKTATGSFDVNGAVNPYSINKAVYTGTITGDAAKDKMFTYNKAGQLEVSKDFEVRKNYSADEKDGIYAAIRPEQSLTLNVFATAPVKNLLSVDASGRTAPKVYGIYNTSSGVLTWQDTNVPINIDLKGAAGGAGIYSSVSSGTSTMNIGTSSNTHRSNALTISGDQVEGILAGSNSTVNINLGKTVINTSGTGLHAQNGGEINVSSYSYGGSGNMAAYAESGGVVNINNWKQSDWFGAVYQDLKGDLVTDDTGVINYNLSGTKAPKASSWENKTTWTGNADGNIHLSMNGGSTWNGLSLSDKTVLSLNNGSIWNIPETAGKDSVVGTLTGGDSSSSGYIYMGSSGKNVKVDNLSGYTTLFYPHKAESPVQMEGGNFVVDKAGENSFIRMVTGNEGLNTDSEKAADKNLVSQALNALAGKLYYSAYVSGERNLSGTVEIAEGLTSSASSLKVGNITFKDSNGQGSYVYTPAEDKSYDKTFSTPLDTRSGKHDEYIKDGAANSGNNRNYNLSGNTLIEVGDDNKITTSGGDNLTTGIYISSGSVKIHTGGDESELDIRAESKDTAAGVDVSNRSSGDNRAQFNIDGPVNISSISSGDNAYGINLENGKLDVSAEEANITVKNSGDGDAYGLRLTDNSSVTFNTVLNMNGTDEDGITSRNGTAYGIYAEGNWKMGTSTINGLQMKLDGTGIYTGYDNSSSYVLNITGNTVLETPDAEGNHRAMELHSGHVVLGAKDSKTDIQGNILTSDGAVLDMVLGNSGSRLLGNTELSAGGSLNLTLANGAVWRNRSVGTVESGFDGSHLTRLNGGSSASSAGIIYQNDSHPVTIDDYSGFTKVIYSHEGDGADASDYTAGNVIVSKAETGSGITISTDNTGIDTSNDTAVARALNALAGKLYYSAYTGGERNLDGTVEIAEGLISSSSAVKTGSIAFDSSSGQGSYDADVKSKAVKMMARKLAVNTSAQKNTSAQTDQHEIVMKIAGNDASSVQNNTSGTAADARTRSLSISPSQIVKGPSETAIMRGTRDAMTTSMLAWREGLTDMNQRLGDIHLGAESGIWARTYGGQSKYNKGRSHIKNNYWGAQVGADKRFGSGWHAGIALDYEKGDADYIYGGDGTPKLYMLSAYGTKVWKDNSYLDLVLSGGRTENDFTVYNEMRHQVDGDYGASGISLSVEYGKRFGSAKGYIQPEIQLIASHLGSDDYSAASDYENNKALRVHQDSMNSVLGRIGIAAGKQTERGSWYLKAGLFHEFDGNTSTTFSAYGEPTKSVHQDLGDTWVEIALGGAYRLSPSSMLYADIRRSYGGDYKVNWKLNAGLRFAF